MPSKCSIFSAGDKLRQPGGSSEARGMRGNAIMLPAVLSAYAELALSLERGACHVPLCGRPATLWQALARAGFPPPYLPRTSARPVVPAPFLSTGSRAGAGVSGSLFGFRSRAPGRSPLPRALIFPVPVAPTHKAGSHAIARTQADVWELVLPAPIFAPRSRSRIRWPPRARARVKSRGVSRSRHALCRVASV